MIDFVDSFVLGPGFTRSSAAMTERDRILSFETLLSYPGEMAMDAAWRRVEPSPAAVPTKLKLGTLPHPQVRLRVPMRLTVERVGDFITVWNEEIEELGYGSHLMEAVEDFQQTVVELYLALRQDEERLGPALLSLRTTLDHLIEWRP